MLLKVTPAGACNFETLLSETRGGHRQRGRLRMLSLRSFDGRIARRLHYLPVVGKRSNKLGYSTDRVRSTLGIRYAIMTAVLFSDTTCIPFPTYGAPGVSAQSRHVDKYSPDFSLESHKRKIFLWSTHAHV